jgi:hypothetical protein
MSHLNLNVCWTLRGTQDLIVPGETVKLMGMWVYVHQQSMS